MPSLPQAYFAYGSNLCVRQMAQRCADASHPQRAVLTEYGWLINQRGVATVEPSDGAHVHGVIWQVSNHDLANLDNAEGVPVRYRRNRMTVHTEDGPSHAWVYVDYRVNPGAPRPGYLECIIGGAVHHGLPQRWIDFLRGWDPTHSPRPLPRPISTAPQPLSAPPPDPRAIETGQLLAARSWAQRSN